MDIKVIQKFIDETTYDFQTVEYLLEYSRVKETVPILQQILERIRTFRGQAADQEALRRIFQDNFWAKSSQGRSAARIDWEEKIREMAGRPQAISEKELQHAGYLKFIELLREGVYKRMDRLRHFIKSPLRKKIESALRGLSAVVLALGAVAIAVFWLFLRDWGVKGDFYRGQNFETHVSSGYNMTIDFKDYLEMNTLMPRGDSSARWQGFLLAPRDGAYTFSVKVSGGARLYLDGDLLIDQWNDNNQAQFSRTVHLNKGGHWLSLEYFHHWNDALLELSWGFEGGRQGIIPAWFLRSKSAMFSGAGGLKPQILVFTPQNVESGNGWIQTLNGIHAYWPAPDHVLASNPEGTVSVAKYFIISRPGRYLVTIFHDSAPDFVDARVRISCAPPLAAAMPTWAPVPVYSQDSYICEFPAGMNSVHIGGNGNASRHFLGVNSVVIKPF